MGINVSRRQSNKYPNQVIRGKLALVDLAGSERACETNSGGQKLRDGANINKSLLALANCINALGKQQKKGLAYVPYRNSKLTRILKGGLSGNSQTIMLATISPANGQYHHTVNTLKYASRAKEIRTHIQKNIGTVDTHVSDYQRLIDNLQNEVSRLRKELAEKESQLIAKPTEKSVDDEMSWLNILSQETSENVQERINLQKALFELEDTNVQNHTELQQLDDAIAKQQSNEKDGAVVQMLRSRRQVVLDNIRDNDELGVHYQTEIETNEKRKCQLQDMIEEAITNNGNQTYLRILSQYRLLGIANTELQFEMAMRDQIIHNQREALKNLWNLVLSLGLEEKQIFGLAEKQGITVEESISSPQSGLTTRKHLSNLGCGRYSPSSCSPYSGFPSATSSAFPQEEEQGSRTCSKENWRSPHSYSEEEHHSAYCNTSNSHPPSVGIRQCSQYWSGNETSCQYGGPDGYPPPHLQNPYPHMKTSASPYDDGQQQDLWTNSFKQQIQPSPCVGGVSRIEDSQREVVVSPGGTKHSLLQYSRPLQQVSAIANLASPEAAPSSSLQEMPTGSAILG